MQLTSTVVLPETCKQTLMHIFSFKNCAAIFMSKIFPPT